jgi:hypothetical protein
MRMAMDRSPKTRILFRASASSGCCEPRQTRRITCWREYSDRPCTLRTKMGILYGLRVARAGACTRDPAGVYADRYL